MMDAWIVQITHPMAKYYYFEDVCRAYLLDTGHLTRAEAKYIADFINNHVWPLHERRHKLSRAID
jgi:hypothetical protein